MTTLVALRAPRWHVHAACRSADREVDWTDTEPGSNSAEDCRAICHPCPVHLTCAIPALTTDERYGVWGAMDPSRPRSTERCRCSDSSMSTTPDTSQRTRRQQQHEAVDVVFEINLVDGTEAERLAIQQAAVIRNIVRWCRPNGNSA
ncbi:hypothetical protein Aglo03_48530 [Actinokineospora globicatena]|uniref:4Fe-4S Wbl-type domain-containing protein n=1 Tax=Actinokineospora globicatena TaxID=103729 RepID=A0A9W6VA79_9PSEU|nr:hypothetical protein Aglo03_48530 [Actinokineospora globicatena]